MRKCLEFSHLTYFKHRSHVFLCCGRKFMTLNAYQSIEVNSKRFVLNICRRVAKLDEQ